MTSRLKYLFFCVCFLPSNDFGQDTTMRQQEIHEIQIDEKRIFKRIGLYDSYEQNSTPSINGFSQLTIFDNTFSDEVWSSEGKKCVEISLKEETENAYLNLKWNKDQEGCDWVGIGFGWDFWSSKDMGQILQISALEIEVRSKGKDIGNLPWAFAFEDFSGGQAWMGFHKNFMVNGIISTDWSKVQIPLSLFPFEEFDCDATNIKQLIIQLFAQDEVEINSIKIVPFTGKLKEEVVATRLNSSKISTDGDLVEWSTKSFTKIDDRSEFAMQYQRDSLFIAVKVWDETPRTNDFKKNELWKGDAIELAFATNPNANPKRKLFLLSDYHLGLNCGSNPYLWSFTEEKNVENAKFAIKNNDNSYTSEIAIAWKDLTKTELISNTNVDFEIAVDFGEQNGKPREQHRWNSKKSEGFHQNPSLWGTVVFE